MAIWHWCSKLSGGVNGAVQAGERLVPIVELGNPLDVAAPSEGVIVVGGVWSEDLGPAWMPTARAAFMDRADRHAAAVKGECWVWPVAGGAVADAPSVLSFVRARPRWKFVLDPVSMMVPALLDRASDHLRRIFEVLGMSEQLGAVVISSCAAEGDRLVHREFGGHELFDREVLRWWGACGRPEIPVILLEGDTRAQEALRSLDWGVGNGEDAGAA